MVKQIIIISSILLSLFFLSEISAQTAKQEYMLDKINKLRSEGCNCSGKYMRPAPALTWNNILLQSALIHAKDMNKKDYFSHYSLDGADIGDRLDDVGYSWSYCGENLGSGQQDFDEVMRDWIKSKSHCLMLMNQKVEEVAVAKSGKYWVQHFGEKYNKTNRRKSK